MKASTIIDTIGNTPHVKINWLFPSTVEVWCKLERTNPGGSIKDRIAKAMIEDAEQQGILKPGSVIIEPTSGNTGIGLALIAAVKKYRLIIVMPESFSVERRKIMTAFGAEIVLTAADKGMKGAIEKAKELVEQEKNAWMPMQFENISNVNIHAQTTAREIIADFPEGIDYLFAGVGTGGHISGLAKTLKGTFPDIKVFAIEPEDSPVIAGGKPGPHALQGIGAGFIPANLFTELLDGTVAVSKNEAYDFTRKAAKEEGVFLGISSGAVLAAVAKKLPGIPQGSRILTMNYDSGEKYLSVEGLF